MASGIVVIITAWCIQMRGPLFASVFNPLMLVLVAITGSLMLNENLYVGRYALNVDFDELYIFGLNYAYMSLTWFGFAQHMQCGWSSADCVWAVHGSVG